jgi:penicillin-binding protein 2
MNTRPTAKRDLMAISSRRAFMIGAIGVTASGAIGARLLYLQTLDPTDYAKEAENNQFDQRPIIPKRGVIHDRFGVPLAITSPDYRVTVRPELAKGKLDEVIAKVGEILGLAPEVVARRVRDAKGRRVFDDVLIRQGLTWDQFAAINVRLPELPGVAAEVGQQRFYPYTAAFAHPIGYVSKPNQREIEVVEKEDREARGIAPGATFESSRARYLRHPDVRVGKSGLEASMENELRGKPGIKLVEVNASGREVGENDREHEPAVPGQPVVLTLDADMQRAAMERMSGESAACVVMDIWTGDIIVMASSPGFDPNLFVNGIGAEPFKALNESEYKPLFHKSVTGAYKPGSTFKIVTGAAAIEAGMDKSFRVSCPGFFSFGGRRFHCWKRGGHGSVDFHAAMKGSCNVFFYNAALRAGPEKIADMARRLGLDKKYDINVPAVHAGIIPDPQWWQEKRNEPWPPGMTLNTGIGQGDILATPLQLAVMTARVANGGRAVMPRLVREGMGVAPAPQEWPKIAIAAETLQPVLDGLFGVCNEPGGTALTAGRLNLARDAQGRVVEAANAPAGSLPVQMAGKTGTAQVRVITVGERASGVKRNEDLPWRMRDHALFVCYAPFDAPRYACAVVVEHGGGGSRVAAPIASDVMRAVLLSDPSSRRPAQAAELAQTPLQSEQPG